MTVTSTVPILPTPPTARFWDAFFTTPMAAWDEDDLSPTPIPRLLALIEAANRTIHVACFELKLPQLADALIAAHQRGVEVLVVTDNEHGIEGNHDDGIDIFDRMIDAGIPVHDDDRGGLMHDKFWIFDSTTVWTGSTNTTVNGVFRNNNNVVIVRSRAIAAMFEREFDEMWGGSFGITSPSTKSVQVTSVDGTSVRVLFGAEDTVADELVTYIDAATTRVRFMAFSFTHDAIGDAMLARHDAGVKVEGIFEKTGSKTVWSELTKLHDGGASVRQDGNTRTFHHKAIVIDSQRVITGSFNFSKNANKSNDENVIVIDDADLAAAYEAEFATQWAKATVPVL